MHHCGLLLLTTTLALIVKASPCQAQGQVLLPADSVGGCSVIRLDIGGPLGFTADYNFMRRYFKPIVPVLLSYERVVDPHKSVGVEVLLWGGRPQDVRWGGGIQGRYYLVSQLRPAEGLYLAGAVRYRAVRTDLGYRDWWQHWAGPGLSVGWQLFNRKGHWGVDVALGVNYWGPLSSDVPLGSLTNLDESMYQKSRLLPDGRLGVAYRWGKLGR